MSDQTKSAKKVFGHRAYHDESRVKFKVSSRFSGYALL